MNICDVFMVNFKEPDHRDHDISFGLTAIREVIAEMKTSQEGMRENEGNIEKEREGER